MTSRDMSSGLQGAPSRPTCRSSNRHAFTWRSISRRRHRSAFRCRTCSSPGPTRCANEAPRVHHAARRRGGGVAARGTRAQARKLALIAWLTGAPLSSTTSTRMFLQGLQDLGYVEAREFQMTYRSSDGYQDRLPALAQELVRLNPDVIVAAGLDAVVAARNVTQTIPIVSATLADAIHLGLIASEAQIGR